MGDLRRGGNVAVVYESYVHVSPTVHCPGFIDGGITLPQMVPMQSVALLQKTRGVDAGGQYKDNVDALGLVAR